MFGANHTLAKFTDPGDRPENQDAMTTFSSKGCHLLVVCDGLGGHEGGQVASLAFCAAVARDTAWVTPAAGLEELGSAALRAARSVAAELSQNPATQDAQTTAALALITPQAVHCAHVGDSRVIGLSPEFSWRTRDHSVVQMLLDQGEIDESQMGTHPEQGKLLRSIGAGAEPRFTLKTRPSVAPGHAVLLCSDGLWEHTQIEEYSTLAQSWRLQRALEKAVSRAVKRAHPKSDNVTAVIYRR